MLAEVNMWRHNLNNDVMTTLQNLTQPGTRFTKRDPVIVYNRFNSYKNELVLV